MNFLALSLFFMAAGGSVFGLLGGPDFVGQNASALLSVVSIMSAGILVRLNRGIPAVDWKTVDQKALENLLVQVERIAKTYVTIFALAISTMSLILVCILFKGVEIRYKVIVLRSLATLVGASVGLLISRMCHVVWLDLDIVRLQRILILSAADSSDVQRQAAAAQGKLEEMNRVRIRTLT